MADNVKSRRLFTEKEVGAILKRATELQESEGVTDTTGLTWSELEQLASDIGITRRYVTFAVAEMEQDDSVDSEMNFWGGPLSFDHERMVEGEVTEETWERMVATIRKTFKDSGKINQWGKSLEWVHSGRFGEQANVTITPREGRTKIHIFSHIPALGAAIYVFVLFFVLAAILLQNVNLAPLYDLPALLEACIYLCVMVAVFALPRWAIRKTSSRERRKKKKLLDRLEQIVGENRGSLESAGTDQEKVSPFLHSEKEQLDSFNPELGELIKVPKKSGSM